MTRMHQSRRHLLKSAAAVSAAVPFAKIGMMPSFAAEGERRTRSPVLIKSASGRGC